jgi:phosphate starvation-inducible protein PhoH and related proteins
MTKWRDTRFFGLDKTLTDEQVKYLDAMENPGKKLIIVNAKAGTGKTTLATAMAKLSGKELLYVFNPTEEDTLGFTPGDPEEKERKYLGPLLDALEEIKEDPAKVIKSSTNTTQSKQAWVTAKSHVYVRGTNTKDKFVIIDEAQNWTKKDLKKMLTRLHDSCIVVVIGHVGQIDLPKPELSGFPRVIEHFEGKWYAEIVELTKNFRGILATDADEL